MGLRTLFKALADREGIELSDDELESLGLDEEEGDGETEVSRDETLSQELPGHAAGMVEVFSNDTTVTKLELSEGGANFIEGADGLMWYPIIREGQWAVRPGQQGSKKKVPLKVVGGKSTNQRRQIGLQDLKDAFDDEAIQHVTVPTSHANTTVENTGFIAGMKIVEGEVKTKASKGTALSGDGKQKVKVLLGGYDIKLPEIKRKMKLGAIANRSAGILYDYVNTETGKTYPAVVEHVALTNKPWITGMISFGRKLSEGGIADTVSLSLSDESPLASDEEYALALSEDDSTDFLAQEAGEWSKEDDPEWLQRQVSRILSSKRAEKEEKRRKAPGGNTLIYSEDRVPYYRCVSAKPGMALVADDWGDQANFWSAPIKIVEGEVELGEYSTWSKLKKAYVPDERKDPPKEKLPLSEQQDDGAPDSAATKSTLQLAQEARRSRGLPSGEKTDDNPREVVGNMAGNDGSLQLSEEAQRAIQAAEAKAAELEQRLKLSDEKIARLTGSVQGGEVDKYIDFLKADPDEKGKGGLGLSEERGFGGVLAEVRQLMLADDGEAAVQSDHFSADGNKEGTLTLSESIKRVFGALEKAQEGKKSIGEALSEPADGEPAGGKTTTTTPEGAADGTSTAVTTSTGTPATTLSVPSGKPGAGDEVDVENLSTDDKVRKMAEASPELAALVPGITDTPKEA